MRIGIFALTIMVFLLAGSVYGQALPREILNSYVDQYFSALVAHDPDRLPLTPDARYTEPEEQRKPKSREYSEVFP